MAAKKKAPRPRGKPVASLGEAMDRPAAAKLADVPEEDVTRLSEELREERDPPPRSIDDVVRRHVSADDVSPAHGHRAVPPDARPDRRDGPTLGPVKVIYDDVPEEEDHSDDRIRTLEDLMARFPFTGPGGDYYIHVNRKQPRSYNGLRCHGVQRMIVWPLRYKQFQELYGGGEYELIVYGPPRGPGVIDPYTGKPQPKALTRPIVFTVPYDRDGITGLGPNPTSSLPDIEDHYPMESAMQPAQPTQPTQPAGVPAVPHPYDRTGPRITTQADAELRKVDLNYTRDMMDRQAAADEREAARVAAAEASKAQVELERLKMEDRDQTRAADIAAERAQNAEASAAALQKLLLERTMGQSVDIPKLIQVIKGDDSGIKLELQRAHEAHQSEITRLMEAQKREIEDVRAQCQRDIERERSMCDAKVAAAQQETVRDRDRSEQKVKDAEERAERRVKDAEDRADRRVKEAEATAVQQAEMQRRDFDRELKSVKESFETQLASERRSAEQSSVLRKEMIDTQTSTAKAAFDMRVEVLNHEVERLRAENRDLRKEIAEKGDVVAQVQKVTEVATALGFTKQEGRDDEGGEEETKPPTDWRSMAVTIGTELVQNLPALVKSAGESFAAVRSTRAAASASPPASAPVGGVPAPVPELASPPRFRHRLFATENEPMMSPDLAAPQIAPVPIYPSSVAPSMTVSEPPPAPPSPMSLGAVPVVVSPPSSAPSPVSVPPPPSSAAASVPPPPASARQQGEAEDAIDAELAKFIPVIEQAYADEMSPAGFVQGLVETVGPGVIRTYAQVLTTDRIVRIIESQPNGSFSPLVNFKGKEWIRAFEAAARAV